MLAPYHAAHATIASVITHTHTGIEECVSARCGSNGSSALNALTPNSITPWRTVNGTSCTETLPVRSVARTIRRCGPSARVAVSRVTDVGRSCSTNGCSLPSRNTWTWALAGATTSSSVIVEHLVFGVSPVAFAGTNQHPRRRHKTRDGDRAGDYYDDDVAQPVSRETLHQAALNAPAWRARRQPAPLSRAARCCPRTCARDR